MVNLAHHVILVAEPGSSIREYSGIAVDRSVREGVKSQVGFDNRIDGYGGGLSAGGVCAK